MCCYHCSYLLTSTKACSAFCAALFCATFLEPQALRAQQTAHQHPPLTNAPDTSQLHTTPLHCPSLPRAALSYPAPFRGKASCSCQHHSLAVIEKTLSTPEKLHRRQSQWLFFHVSLLIAFLYLLPRLSYPLPQHGDRNFMSAVKLQGL